MRSKFLPVLLALLIPTPAFAAFHLMKVVEVFPGTESEPNAQYVVLQMYSGLQNRVSGHQIRVFDDQGNQIAAFTFENDTPNTANQSKILIATVEAQALFGITADLVMDVPAIPLRGGKVCFDSSIDCVAWGSFTGSQTGVGTPFNAPLGLVTGKAIQRRLDITGGATNLENGDDTTDSANDFVFGTPAPRNADDANGTVPGSTCGDAILEGLEQCDDGNTANGDGCSDACEFEDNCGDAVVSGAEECDDGNLNNADTCQNDCTLPDLANCGDGILDEGEACDDGNNVSGDGCRADCLGTEVCGDALLDGGEECDDGNNADEDGCSAACVSEFCGDGILQFGLLEECDDGAANSDETPDACRTNCLLASCGDAVVDGGEECDDGNEAPLDGCSEVCLLEVCGDGVVQAPEECDDGNNVAKDGCDPACVIEKGGLCAVGTPSAPGDTLLLLGICLFGLALLRRRMR